MNKIIIILIIMFSFFNKVSANYTQLAYKFQFKSLDGGLIKLSDYKDKIIVIVNVASRCGFTKQYDDLQNLWTNYKDKDLIVIGVPTNDFKQEPASNSEIKDFCEQNFNINFPMTEKTNVLGKEAHPFYRWAKDNHGKGAIPKWNFHKIIIGKNGKVSDTFASITNPSSKRFLNFIEDQIKN
jgi:glutathione peroxidase|tara:strand:- start:173 stop:718 length:546 start_codon:yes stop_codon:yes gene_type:complete